MIRKKETWASISGGKDSSYIVKWVIENKIPITGFMCALIRKHEEPDMVEHIYRLKKYAEKNGYPFIIMENKNDIEPYMAEVITQKNSPQYGKPRGFPLKFSPCWISRDWKLKLLNRFAKQREVISSFPIIKYIGYTIDEPSPKRQKRIKDYIAGNFEENIRYPLVDMKIKESDCLERIKECGLYCQTHIDYPRSGCWFCQKSPVESRLKAICKDPINRLNQIRLWTKLSGREIYCDITLKEIEAHVSKKFGEINPKGAYNTDFMVTFPPVTPPKFEAELQTS